jgi:hypothetical protein
MYIHKKLKSKSFKNLSSLKKGIQKNFVAAVEPSVLAGFSAHCLQCCTGLPDGIYNYIPKIPILEYFGTCVYILQ